jgi:hypothetical protein
MLINNHCSWTWYPFWVLTLRRRKYGVDWLFHALAAATTALNTEASVWPGDVSKFAVI